MDNDTAPLATVSSTDELGPLPEPAFMTSATGGAFDHSQMRGYALREAAAACQRLSSMLDHRNDEAAETERMLRAALRAMLDDDDHDAAKNAARAAIAGLEA